MHNRPDSGRSSGAGNICHNDDHALTQTANPLSHEINELNTSRLDSRNLKLKYLSFSSQNYQIHLSLVLLAIYSEPEWPTSVKMTDLMFSPDLLQA